jgi:hypothetical protein
MEVERFVSSSEVRPFNATRRKTSVYIGKSRLAGRRSAASADPEPNGGRNDA